MKKEVEPVISEKLKKLRTSHRLTQSEIGKQLGCSAARISGYENGKTCVSYDVVKAYVKRFGCLAEYLLNDAIPLMDEPETLETNPIVSKIPVLKNCALPANGNNVWKMIYHPYFDNAPSRKAWLTKDKNDRNVVVIYMETTVFREGDHVVAVLDGERTVLGYYYLDEERRICIKAKPKGEKGNRNLRIGLEKDDKLLGIVELIIK